MNRDVTVAMRCYPGGVNSSSPTDECSRVNAKEVKQRKTSNAKRRGKTKTEFKAKQSKARVPSPPQTPPPPVLGDDEIRQDV